MDLIAERDGTVRFNGSDISRLQPYEIARLRLGFAPEDRRIFADLTVLENLDIGRQPPRTFRDGIAAPVWSEQKLLALFPNLGEMPNRPRGRMSGGEQQMLTMARTLMGNPLLVRLDEPSEGVAQLIVEQMAKTIIELKRTGVSILLSEQNGISPNWCRTGPMCWKKARSSGMGPWRSWLGISMFNGPI
jgi:branched-chain amino acid transport system ATP-binding protein